MDQPSDTQNDNPFKPEEEASFNELAAESTGTGAPAVVPAEPVVVAPSPFAAPADPITETPIAPVVPAAPFADGQPLAMAPKKKKKWLPLAIAGGALVLLGGSASAYYFGVYQNPENVLYDAYSHLAAAKAMQASGSMNFDMPVVSGVKLKSIDYSSNFENNPSGMLAITAKLTLMSADVSVGGKGMYTDNGDLYFQLNGVVDAVKAYMDAMGATEADVPASFYTSLGKVQDQWVKVAMADLKEASKEAGDAYQCVIDAYKKHKDDSAKPLLEAYKKNAFMVKKGDLGTKDGRIGYKLSFDMTKAKAFSDSVADTDLAKDVKACGGSTTEDEDISDTIDSSSVGDITTNVWIDQWTHELKRIEYNGSAGDPSSEVSVDGNVDIAYDKTVKTTAPSDSIDLEEFRKRVEAVVSEFDTSGSTTDSVSNTL